MVHFIKRYVSDFLFNYSHTLILGEKQQKNNLFFLNDKFLKSVCFQMCFLPVIRQRIKFIKFQEYGEINMDL